MKQKLTLLVLCLCLFCTGCSWMDGSYLHITPHEEQKPASQGGSVTVSSFQELQDVMLRMTENGVRKNVIFLSDYDQTLAESGMASIRLNMLTYNPLGCYALKDIRYEVGTNSGKPAIAVELEYRHTAAEIRQIRRFKGTKEAIRALSDALDDVKPGMVMLIRDYEDLDFVQLVNDYAQRTPQKVMEVPQVIETLYGSGNSRLVELVFTYQTSRDSLKMMRSQVEPVFEAAELYVSEGATDYQKYNQLYSFLMERFEYEIQSSITPSYSLLHHGVGDSRAFANIYAAMCRSVDLSCDIVTGTRDGEPWTWNITNSHGSYAHIDLLRCTEEGRFRMVKGSDMAGYVWDYSTVPGSSPTALTLEPAAEIQPAETPTEEKP